MEAGRSADTSSSAPPGSDDSGLPLPGDPIEARHRLPRRVIGYWRVRGALFGAVLVAILALLAWRTSWFTAQIRWTAVGLVAVVALVLLAIVPPIRHRIFWYAISPAEIDISSGFYVRTRTVVPMHRVQHLRTDHGPIADRFRVATLHIHTAAGTIRLADLDRDEAEVVRSRIAALAQLADDV